MIVTKKILIFLALLLIIWGRCVAANLQIDPLGIQLAPPHPVDSITLSNWGDSPILIQVKAYTWQQQGGKDIYTETQNLLITPPIVFIKPGQQQLLRLGWIKQAFPAQEEQALRLYIQQVPAQTSSNLQEKSSVMISLRIGIPVFIEPLILAQPELHWQIKPGKNNKLILSVENTGNMHVKIVHIDLAYNGQLLSGFDTFQYLLPHQTHSWEITQPRKSHAPWKVTTKIDSGILAPVIIN